MGEITVAGAAPVIIYSLKKIIFNLIHHCFMNRKEHSGEVLLSLFLLLLDMQWVNVIFCLLRMLIVNNRIRSMVLLIQLNHKIV